MIMRTVPALLVFLLLFGFTACGRKLQNDTDIGNTAAVSSEDRPDKGKLSGGKGQAGQADQADQTDQTNQEMSGPLAKKETQKIQKEQKALLWLQEYMAGYAPQAAIAAAYLGYREAEDTTSLTQWMKNNAPELVKEMPFILTIPPERILGSDHGNLYCIVPGDDRTTLSVNHVTWKSTGNGVWPESDKVLYRDEYAEPVLVFVGYEEFYDEPDIEIVASDSGGAGGIVTWNPIWNPEDGGYMIIPTGEDYEPLVLDFTKFGNGMDLEDWNDPDNLEPAGDDWWVPPTDVGLADTGWVCDGWYLNLLGGDENPDYAGTAELYCQFEDGQEYQLLYYGVWKMVDDCLQLIVSTGVGNTPSDGSGVFPVLIDPSGEYLYIQQDRDNGMCPPFFEDGVTSTVLTRSYG